MTGLGEADTCRRFVVPKLVDAGCDDEPHSIAEQRTFTDGRFLAVEYKGSHLETIAATEEKDAIGQLWAARSKGWCHFAVATRGNIQAIIGHAVRTTVQ